MDAFMIFQEKEIRLKDGRSCMLRPAKAEDAEEVLACLKTTAGETPFLLSDPDEITFTVEGEKAFIEGMLEASDSFLMIASVDGKVAGTGSINGIGNRRKIRHRCSLAIALYREYQGLGIGTAMLKRMEEVSAQMGYLLVELEVVEGNDIAQALYQKCGFLECGKRHRAFRFEDGTYRDEILMYKEL